MLSRPRGLQQDQLEDHQARRAPGGVVARVFFLRMFPVDFEQFVAAVFFFVVVAAFFLEGVVVEVVFCGECLR